MKEIIIPENVKTLMHRLMENGYDSYVIGGACRDLILGETPKDWDIFTNCPDLKAVFPEGVVIGNDDRQAKILTLIVEGIEISRYRGNGDRTEFGKTLIDHCDTCDFTFNAIALDINGWMIDGHNGIKDLEDGIIRFVGNPDERINEDYLRILRGIRFNARYPTFRMDTDAAYAIQKNFGKLKELPMERIRDEMLKIMKYGRTGINMLIAYGFVDMFIPELKVLETIPHGGMHIEDPFQHSLFAFYNAVNITDDQRLHLACLFHDLGKFPTMEKLEDGKVKFDNHAYIGADLVKVVLDRFKFSNEDIKFISTTIRHHMMGDVSELNNNTIIKIVNDLESAGISVEDMLVMTYSDNQANMMRPRMKFNEFYQRNNWLRKVHQLKYERMPFNVKDLAIKGQDAMALGLKGKEIGDTLKQIFEEVVEAKIRNERHELLYRLKEMVANGIHI